MKNKRRLAGILFFVALLGSPVLAQQLPAAASPGSVQHMNLVSASATPSPTSNVAAGGVQGVVQPANPAAAGAVPMQQASTVVASPGPSLPTNAPVYSIGSDVDVLPVSIAKNGFTPAQAAEFLARFNGQESMKAGDVSLFAFLNFTEVQHTATIKRAGPVAELKKVSNATVAKVRAKTEQGDLSLEEYLANPRSRTQAMVVVHHGRIVFEQYPGMREQDNHVWMSCTKTLASHLIGLLEEEGKIDVQRPVDFYMPQFRDTAWAGTKVIDVLDMATGLDIEESSDLRSSADSPLMRMTLAGSGLAYNGKVERMSDVLRSVKRLKPPGEAFDYSSVATLMLTTLAESVQKRRWTDIFQSRVWSKLYAEGDLQIGLTPDGFALSHALAIGRLRDMARYGMLYTPSWNKIAQQPLVSAAYLKKIQTSGRTDLYLRGTKGRLMAGSFAGDAPVANSYQWDAVFADGDIFKSGLMGQGLYVSPGRDVVIAWFSTAQRTDLTHYARSIVKSFAAGEKG
jgi:CubicO group peptidase (beta-lactamase class C family)